MPVFNTRLITPILLSLLLFHAARAQQKEWNVAMLDSNKAIVEDSASAFYYRTVEQMPDHYLVRDYYRDHTIEMRSECAAYFPDLIEEGLTTHYYKNGVKKIESYFIEGKQSAFQKTYYESGQMKELIDHNRPTPIIVKRYDENGKEELLPGNLPRVRDGVAMYDTLAEDLTVPICQQPEVAASYPGGMDAMAIFLQNTIKYPTFARTRGVEGTLFVSFVVNQNGRISDADILKYLDKDLEKEALRVVKAMPKWNPGICGGAPARTRFVLPMHFKLTSPKSKKNADK